VCVHTSHVCVHENTSKMRACISRERDLLCCALVALACHAAWRFPPPCSPARLLPCRTRRRCLLLLTFLTLLHVPQVPASAHLPHITACATGACCLAGPRATSCSAMCCGTATQCSK